MILRYTPKDGAPQLWDLSTVRFLSSEGETVERTIGVEWSDACSRNALVLRKSVTARRALLWVLLKRNQPALRYSAFDPAIDEIDVTLGADDLAELTAEAEEELAAGRISEEAFEAGMRDLRGITDPDVLAAEAVPVRGPKDQAEELPEAGPAPGAPWMDSVPAASPIAV